MFRMPLRRLVTGVAVGTLALAAPVALTPTPASAATADLFFSEYVEGSSNNKALEVYNGTGSAVDLAAGGYEVRMYFNGNTTASTTVPLTGTVAAGDVFVLAQASLGVGHPRPGRPDEQQQLVQRRRRHRPRQGRGVRHDARRHRPDRRRPRHRVGQRRSRAPPTTPSAARSTSARATRTAATPSTRPPSGTASPTDTFDGLGAHTSSCNGPVVDDAPTVDGHDARRRRHRRPEPVAARHLLRARRRGRRRREPVVHRLRHRPGHRLRWADDLHPRPRDRPRERRVVHAHRRGGGRHRRRHHRPARHAGRRPRRPLLRRQPVR